MPLGPAMHGDELQIWKTRVPRSRFWVIRYIDPDTRQRRQVSTHTENGKEAERQLGELRADLLKGRHRASSSLSWEAFRIRYESEVLPSLAVKTQLKVATIFDKLEQLAKPGKLRELTAERLSVFQAKLREGGRAETTIAGYLAHLRAAMRWAVDVGLLAVVPKMQRPKRAKNSKMMKGRPITDAEFQKMLDKTPEAVGEEVAASWKYYLTGLWWSGLRLGESLQLYWDDDTKLCVHVDAGEVFLRIPAELEKGHKDRLLPVAPEFADFLLSTQECERTGPVFQPKARRVCGPRLNFYRVSETVREIGKAAGVLISRGGKKHASAHDLRRSFGERWAARVMPQVLMELMRHESIETTLKYYVGRNAQRTTKILRQAYDASRNTNGPIARNAHGDTFGDTSAKSDISSSEEKSQAGDE